VPILALILKMDNHKCRLCGSVHNLIVHHIIPIQDCIQNDDRTTWNFIYDNKNLITLCQACHIYQVHDGNGRFYLNENIKNRLLGIAKNRQISEILRKEYEMKVITIREWIKNV
jgi:5-methylcytosine-specific restriction endonuclease McrA